jgi:D-sedoheptulose 7-phosphate isomerase/D-glycero-D-manno-heptose 1,7-bisphosphate phosphatase
MRPGLLLDRDGTIIADYHYVGHTERVQLLPGAAEAIARFNRAGIPVAIVTNQGGVARGFYPERNVQLVHEYIKRELALHGAHIDLFLYSPHHPDAFLKKYAVASADHKPAPGMAYKAAHVLGLDLQSSVVVGDRITDVELARNVGADAVYIGSDPLPDWYSTSGIHQFPSLSAAATFIIEVLTMTTPESTFPQIKYEDARMFLRNYGIRLDQALSHVDQDVFAEACNLIRDAYEAGTQVFVAGNGGAAAIADHFQCDHTKGVTNDTGLKTVVHSLTSNVPLLTAIANDIGYDAVFSRQLELSAYEHDVLVVFSASGTSANIVRALQYAYEANIFTIAVTAFDSEDWQKDIVDAHLYIPTWNYGIAEDCMQAIGHAMAQYIRQLYMDADAVFSARF